MGTDTWKLELVRNRFKCELYPTLPSTSLLWICPELLQYIWIRVCRNKHCLFKQPDSSSVNVSHINTQTGAHFLLSCFFKGSVYYWEVANLLVNNQQWKETKNVSRNKTGLNGQVCQFIMKIGWTFLQESECYWKHGRDWTLTQVVITAAEFSRVSAAQLSALWESIYSVMLTDI